MIICISNELVIKVYLHLTIQSFRKFISIISVFTINNTKRCESKGYVYKLLLKLKPVYNHNRLVILIICIYCGEVANEFVFKGCSLHKQFIIYKNMTSF